MLDPETIEKETKKEDNEFLEQQQNLMRLILQLQNKKKQDHFDELIDDIFYNKPIFDSSSKIEDIFIDADCLFNESD